MKYKKIVIKIGTSTLANPDGSIKHDVLEGVASQISVLLNRNIKVTLVSSGAISAGISLLKLRSIPNSLSDLQAVAAIGQNELMRLYHEAFKKHGYMVGQVLLTQEDFNDRRRYLNIKYTIEALLSKKIVPIVNENDTVSTEEIKCGDNDRLSSLVSDLSVAGALIILTNVDGLYNEGGKVIRLVEGVNKDIKRLVSGKCSFFTKGGMMTKIEAAERVTKSGIDCYIANGAKKDILNSILSARGNYTYFKAQAKKSKAKKRWIAYSSKIKGSIIVDDGAKKALISLNKSLLASGIVRKEGVFKAGDVVSISDLSRKEFARGLINYSSKEIDRIKGMKTVDIEKILGYKDHDEVVHRDNLTIL